MHLPPKRKPISGQRCVKILCQQFGFEAVRQRGSHVVLRSHQAGTVVPLHKELKPGTLRGILSLARVDVEAFYEHV